jgi:hypothetical protein
MIAHPGNGFAMRDDFVRRGLVHLTPDLKEVLDQQQSMEAVRTAAE